MEKDIIRIYGKHPITEALEHAAHTVVRVMLDQKLRGGEVERLARKKNTQVFFVGPETGVFKDVSAHQGMAAEVSRGKLMRPYKEFLDDLVVTPHTALLLLGEVQDPNNVGAVIRSAAAFGISGVLFPKHDQAPVTTAVMKVSAGMAFRVPLVAVGNVNNTIRDLKAKGFWIYGLDAFGDHAVSEESFTEPTVLVLGNEGEGIREKTREACDLVVSVPLHPRCESLNAGASAAVAMYAWSRQHPEALKDGEHM